MSIITDLRKPFQSLNLHFASRFVLARLAIGESPKTETLTHADKFKCGTLKIHMEAEMTFSVRSNKFESLK